MTQAETVQLTGKKSPRMFRPWVFAAPGLLGIVGSCAASAPREAPTPRGFTPDDEPQLPLCPHLLPSGSGIIDCRALLAYPLASPRPNRTEFMKPTNREKIIAFLKPGPRTILEVAHHLRISRMTAGRQLENLRNQGALDVYTVSGAYMYEVRS